MAKNDICMYIILKTVVWKWYNNMIYFNYNFQNYCFLKKKIILTLSKYQDELELTGYKYLTIK